MSIIAEPQLKPFLQTLVRSAHGTPLSEELEQMFLLDVQVLLEQHIQESIVLALPEDKRPEYLLMAEAELELATVSEFINQYVPDIQDRLTEWMEQFEQNYLDTIQADSN